MKRNLSRILALVAMLAAAVVFHLPAISATGDPIVFLGDHNLPPYEFLENGVPKGASVDLAKAIGQVLNRPVEVRLMPWDEAQRRLLAGEGSALTLLARMPEREDRYDFSQATFPVSFSFFVRADQRFEFDPDNIDGKRIGVIKGGLPENYLRLNRPTANLVVLEDNIEGTKKVLRGEIDALAANSWSELYLLKELGVSGITATTPFRERKSNIAVREGEQQLLTDIDAAISQLKQSGEFDRIIDRWSSAKVHLLSDIAVRALVLAGIVVVLGLGLSAVAIIWLRKQKAALSREVAERRRVEAQLLNNQNRLDLAIDTAKIGMFDWDLKTNAVTWTKHHFSIFGFAPYSFDPTYDDFRSRVHPDDIAAIEANTATARESRTDFKNEFRVVWPNGAVRYVAGRGRFLHDADGNPVCVIGGIVDMTEATSALARSERQFSTLVENSPDVFTRLDLSRRYVYVSPAVEHHTGRPAAEFIGKTNEELGMPSHLCEHWNGAMQEAIRTCSTRRIRFIFPHPSGEERFFESRVVPEVDTNGRVESLLVITTDVTEREQMTRVLQDREKALRDADRRKDEFLATLAHELRNPLAPIQNAVQLMRLSGDRDIQRNARDIIERQLDHLVQLIDDLLDVNRINQGKLELRRQVFDIAEAVHNAVETSEPLILKEVHALTVHLPKEPVFVNADATRLTQVIANLLNNAAKYTPRGGKIRLDVEREDGAVLVKVSDTGIGIPPALLPNIFDLFMQVDRGPEHVYGGLGIGLALVRQLVEMHGGSVAAHSGGAGQGTEISIRLPAVAATAAALPSIPVSGATGQATKSIRVLVVDDNVDNADSLTALLELLGYKIATAHEGQAALAAAAQFRPDVVFLDIGLPGLSGHEVARRLRSQPNGEAIFLVAVTGWGQAEDLLRSKEAGFDRHIVKPVTFAALREVLADAVAA